MSNLIVEEVQNEFREAMVEVRNLETAAATLCQDVLESSLKLTPEERDYLKKIRNDEARHFALATKVLKVLPRFSKEELSHRLCESREMHQSRWSGPVERIARLNGDESLVVRFFPGFARVISEIVPEEGGNFVNAVEIDEPLHVAWGNNVLQRLVEEGKTQKRFVKDCRSPRGWPAADILNQFYSLREKISHT